MPGRNGTGPMGMGPMTGRGAGFCGRSSASADAFCGGYRRGYRRMYRETGVPGWARYEGGAHRPYGLNEKQELERQANFFEIRLREINERLSDLETE